MEPVCGFEFGSHLIDANKFLQPFQNMLNWLLFEEACVPTGFQEMFSNHRVFMFNNTLLTVSVCIANNL